jgi:hypothetical protein
VRWEGLEPSRLAAHGPQPCLSANSSTSAKVTPACEQAYYNRLALSVKRRKPCEGFEPSQGYTIEELEG